MSERNQPSGPARSAARGRDPGRISAEALKKTTDQRTGQLTGQGKLAADPENYQEELSFHRVFNPSHSQTNFRNQSEIGVQSTINNVKLLTFDIIH
jgi:hypothetical protein